MSLKDYKITIGEKTYANRQNPNMLREHIYQFDKTCAATRHTLQGAQMTADSDVSVGTLLCDGPFFCVRLFQMTEVSFSSVVLENK